MKIVKYNEKEETLFIQFNTKYIWSYRPVTKEMYEEIKTEKDPILAFIKMIRNNFLIGTLDEVNNEHKI